MKRIHSLVIGIALCILQSAALFAQTNKNMGQADVGTTDTAKQIHWVQGKELDFEDSVRKLKKPAFLYIYINGWTDVAKFNDNVLSDSNIIKYINANFMAYKVDLEYDSPNAMKFMIDKVPAIILFDKDGKEKANLQGYYNSAAFKKFLQQGLK